MQYPDTTFQDERAFVSLPGSPLTDDDNPLTVADPFVTPGTTESSEEGDFAPADVKEKEVPSDPYVSVFRNLPLHTRSLWDNAPAKFGTVDIEKCHQLAKQIYANVKLDDSIAIINKRTAELQQLQKAVRALQGDEAWRELKPEERFAIEAREYFWEYEEGSDIPDLFKMLNERAACLSLDVQASIVPSTWDEQKRAGGRAAALDLLCDPIQEQLIARRNYRINNGTCWALCGTSVGYMALVAFCAAPMGGTMLAGLSVSWPVIATIALILVCHWAISKLIIHSDSNTNNRKHASAVDFFREKKPASAEGIFAGVAIGPRASRS